MNADNWFQWLVGALATVLGFLGVQVHRKAMNSVSRSELVTMFTQLREERQAMHTENKAEIVRVHERLDRLLRIRTGDQ